ncbi:MAG: polysaccharide pyruvyl transferase family protein, partial [Opitutaceae bacterium]
LHVDHFDNVGAEIYERMVVVAEDFAKRTGRNYRTTNNLIPVGANDALKKTLDLYASADLVLTSRLHGCIIALAMGRRVLAVSGDHKVESFMNAAGLGEWVCDLEEMKEFSNRLDALPGQRIPADFMERSRGQNRAVALQVRALLAKGQT